MAIKTSTVTLTKNRADKLQLCLESLVKQTTTPFEVIILDNNSTDTTRDVIKTYAKKLPIISKTTSGKGYPKLYNTAIALTRGDLIVFLDDDCIADRDWLAKMVRAHNRSPLAVIQGQTYSIPKGNIYVDIMGGHYQNWLQANLINNNQLKVCDNKNLVVPRNILNKYQFSEKMALGSEDIEFAKRLKRNNITVLFEPSAIAYHHERSDFRSFLHQHYRIAKSEAVLDQQLSSKEKVGMVFTKKNLLNTLSFIKRECGYFVTGQWQNALLLPTLYLLLGIIRISGYRLQR